MAFQQGPGTSHGIPHHIGALGCIRRFKVDQRVGLSNLRSGQYSASAECREIIARKRARKRRPASSGQAVQRQRPRYYQRNSAAARNLLSRKHGEPAGIDGGSHGTISRHDRERYGDGSSERAVKTKRRSMSWHPSPLFHFGMQQRAIVAYARSRSMAGASPAPPLPRWRPPSRISNGVVAAAARQRPSWRSTGRAAQSQGDLMDRITRPWNPHGSDIIVAGLVGETLLAC